jgi:uncharacterized repeat protein (TIGR01451 family)
MKNRTFAKQLISIALAVVLSLASSAALARDSLTRNRNLRAEAFAPQPKARSANSPLLPEPTPTPPVNGQIAFTHLGDDGGLTVEQLDTDLEQMAVINEDGSDMTTLTFGPHAEDAAWSPDGSKLAYSTVRDDSLQIWVMNADGSEQTCVTSNSLRRDDGPAWSPDGTKLAFTGGGQIWVVNADGTNEVKLSDGTTLDDYPDWSPDGSKIVFTKDAMSGNAQTCVMDADGSNLVNLSNNSWAERDPDWSPDGSKIAYYSFQDGHYEIYVMDADGSNQTQLTKTDYEVANQDPAWSPDGTKLAFMTNRDGNAEVYVMDSDGGNQTRVTNDPAQDFRPGWGQHVPLPEPTPTPTPVCAELSLSATVNPDAVTSGGTALYEIIASNSGNTTANAVTLSCLFPAGVAVNSINNSYGSCASEPDEGSSGTRVECALGNIPNAETKSITLNATATGMPNDWLQATISVASDTTETASDDNFAYPAITILGPPEANILLDASVQPAMVTPGGTITFNGVVFNNGPYQATGANITTTLPTGLTVNTAATSVGSCTLTTVGGVTTVTCPLGDMSIFTQQTVTISATVSATADDANAEATMTVGSALPDPYPPDNTVNVPFLIRQSTSGPGGQLAFVSYRDGNAEIYLANADGSELVNLTNNQASDSEPAWSPDGSKIVFNSDRSSATETWVMNADGSNPAQLTTNGANGAYFVWSPDGTKIAWRDYKDGNYDICVINADGTGFQNLTDDANYQSSPQWSPDSERILYEDYISDANSEVLVINADGTGKTNLSDSPDTSDYAPVWSPDGTKVAFARGYGNSNQGIYVMGADGSNQVNLTNTDDDGYPSWSPDGTKIAFSRLLNYTQMIYVMNADGSNQEPVFVGHYNGGVKPEWSPDGAGLSFQIWIDSNSEVCAVNVDGSGLTNVSNVSDYDAQAKWQPVANPAPIAPPGSN